MSNSPFYGEGVNDQYEHTWFGEPTWMPRFLSPWYQRRMRREMQDWDKQYRWKPLADYNGECARGIVHTPEYDARMAEEQRLFNAEPWP